LRRIRIAAARKDRTAALARFRELLVQHTDFETAKTALQELERSGWFRDGEQCVDALVLDSKAPGEVGSLWVEIRQPRANTPWKYAGLSRVLANPTCGQHAARAYLRAWAGKSAWRVRFFAWRFAQLLAADDETHGLVGYALLESGAPAVLERWFRRFPPRPGTAPWALLNLAVSLHRLGREEEAAGWSRSALERPEDHTAASHRSWLALHAARTQQWDEAETLLKSNAGDELRNFYQFLQALTRALLVAHRQGRREGLAAAIDEVRRAQALMPRFRDDALLARLWRETIAGVARSCTSSALQAGLLTVKLRWTL
jgi:hypothetical protein